MDSFAIITLLTIDISLQIIGRVWDSMQPKPLTSLEAFNLIYDQREDLVKILKDENDKSMRANLENYLKMQDAIKKSKDEKR
mgnify:FL=1